MPPGRPRVPLPSCAAPGCDHPVSSRNARYCRCDACKALGRAARSSGATAHNRETWERIKAGEIPDPSHGGAAAAKRRAAVTSAERAALRRLETEERRLARRRELLAATDPGAYARPQDYTRVVSQRTAIVGRHERYVREAREKLARIQNVG